MSERRPFQVRFKYGEGPEVCGVEVDLRDLGKLKFWLKIPGTAKVSRSVTREQLVDIRDAAALAIVALDAAAGREESRG